MSGKLDISAQRQGGDAPAGAALVGPPGNLFTEAYGEHVGLHAEPAPDKVMPQLMQGDERPQHQQEADDHHPEGNALDCIRHSAINSQ